MSNECRKAFEDTVKEKNPAVDMNNYLRMSEGIYFVTEVRLGWLNWQLAWNAGHQRCAEICSEPIGGESLSDYAAGAINISLEHVESIQNDKVKI